MKQETFQYNTIHLERRILSFYGIYFGKDFPLTKQHYVRVITTFLTLAFFVFCMVMKIIVDRTKFGIVFQTAYHVVVVIIGVIKTFSIYRALPQFNGMENMLQEPIFNTETSTECNFIWKEVNKFNFFKKQFWRMSVFTTTIYTSTPLIDGTLPIPIWYPGEKFKAFYGIYEIVCIWIAAGIVISTDLILMGLIFVMSAQIKTLNYNLRSATNKNPEYDLKAQEKQVQDKLKICIRHHLAISDFIIQLQEIFSFGLFLEILSSIIAICSSGVYLVAVDQTPSTLAKVVAFMTMVSFKIAMQCWVGQGLITESERIGESCYISEWYTCSTATIKMFFIIMERAKKIISFKAGNFFQLSFATFVMIIENAYSYFTVIVTAFK